MHKQIVGFFAVVALSCATTTLAAAAPARPSAIDEARMLVGSWSCRTTQAGGLIQPEEDRIERIGNGSWLHGTSRPLEGRSEPVYDFYVGYEGSHWVYIQIYPSANFYFVGISDGSSLTPSSWQIAYPVRLAGYRFQLTADSFTIRYPDLTQFCQREPTPSPSASPPPKSTMLCSIYYWGHSGALQATEELTVSQPGAGWWQGVASTKNPDRVVYAYNLFDLPGKRMSILVNPTTGSYAIAVGSPSKDLNDSVWMVVYPRVQSGFTFRNVVYSSEPGKEKLPSALWLVFKDGYQKCAQR
ncbi:MAG: hypothetical protein WA304_06175 [Candidatus Cybelea sp.]